MKREGLKNEEELQSWFIRRIEKFVKARAKRSSAGARSCRAASRKTRW